MKIAAVPETLLERLITLTGLAPTPIVETFHAAIVARAIMVATRLGSSRPSPTAPAQRLMLPAGLVPTNGRPRSFSTCWSPRAT